VGCHGAWPRSAGSPSISPSVARAGDMRCARACRPDREGRETSDGWAGTVPGDGAANRRVRPVSGTGERGVWHTVARMRVGWPEKKRRWAARMHSTVLDLFESD
jgi:hypothetical protein